MGMVATWVDALAVLLTLGIPLCGLSMYLAISKKQPILGGMLAIVKLLATVRASSVSIVRVFDNHLGRGGLFGGCHKIQWVVICTALLTYGIACLVLNAHIFVKQRRIETTSANAWFQA